MQFENISIQLSIVKIDTLLKVVK